MAGLIVFLVGATVATIVIGVWAVTRWRSSRASSGGRRW